MFSFSQDGFFISQFPICNHVLASAKGQLMTLILRKGKNYFTLLRHSEIILNF